MILVFLKELAWTSLVYQIWEFPRLKLCFFTLIFAGGSTAASKSLTQNMIASGKWTQTLNFLPSFNGNESSNPDDCQGRTVNLPEGKICLGNQNIQNSVVKLTGILPISPSQNHFIQKKDHPGHFFCVANSPMWNSGVHLSIYRPSPTRVVANTPSWRANSRASMRRWSFFPRAWVVFQLIVDHPTDLPSGKHTKNYGKSPFWMGKLTISMVIFNS